MKRKIDQLKVILVLFPLILVSCDMFTKADKKESINNAETDKKEDKKEAAYTYELSSFKKNSTHCNKGKGQCAKVAVQYPFFKQKSASFLNQRIQNKVKATLNNVISEEKPPKASVEKIAQLIVDDYDDFIEEFNDEKEKWDIELIVTNTFQKNNIASFAFDISSSTGGVHPNKTLEYLVFDLKQQKQLRLKDLIKNQRKLTETAEKLFRKQKSIASGANLQQEGYFFENGKFKLNNNIGIDQYGLVVYYNNYEIAPYSMGPSKISIPFYEIKDNLKIKL